MKRIGSAFFVVALLAGGLTAATAVAGKSPLSVLQQTATTVTTATTATTGTTVTTPTTTTPRQPGKMIICHHSRGKGGTHHRTITISQRAWRAHQRHGDTLGPCPSTRAQRVHSSASHVRKFHKNKTLRAELRAEAKKNKSKSNKGKGKGRGRP